MFDVILSPEAQVFYDQADQPLARKLARCFAQLEHDPRHHNNIKRLSGKLGGAPALSNWRVVYRIYDRAGQVNVLGHRSSQRSVRII
jgi:mRNA interferase RelE/StbE